MIEALISLFVLAIGLLGVLGMQAEGTQANQRGMFSTQAAFLAQSMASRIRINDTPNGAGVSAGRYDNTDTNGSYSEGNCDSANCNNTELLAYDRGSWKLDLEAQLPAGRGAIAWDSANQVYTISVIWRERSGGDGAGNDRADSVDLTADECGAIDPPQGFACYRVEMRP